MRARGCKRTQYFRRVLKTGTPLAPTAGPNNSAGRGITSHVLGPKIAARKMRPDKPIFLQLNPNEYQRILLSGRECRWPHFLPYSISTVVKTSGCALSASSYTDFVRLGETRILSRSPSSCSEVFLSRGSAFVAPAPAPAPASCSTLDFPLTP